ncbi:MAG: prophage antirepressor [Comamonadaceae bacterium]|nr:MAG: prophage antirepressor [Comamonadaceae bacterium]
MLRVVQSIPSPKAEPLKLWLAQVGDEYLQEKADPARLLDRARQAWHQQGRSAEWITQRMTGQVTHGKPTDHMSEPELIFAALAELSTRQISESVVASGMTENKSATQSGGHIAAQARQQLESQTGKPVMTGANCLPPVAGKALKAIKASRKA